MLRVPKPPRSHGTQSSAGAGFDVPLRAQALAGLFTAGGTLALLRVLLPHAARSDELAVIGIVAIAYVVAACLMRWARSVPGWLLPVALAWGTTLITAVAYFTAERPSPLIWFYVWIALYSAYFFTRRQVGVQMAYVGLAYGVLLSVQPPTGSLGWWVVGVGTLLVAAALIWTMRVRAESLIARLDDAARTDPLTGLRNRRGFRDQLDLELERARRGESNLSVLVGDVDHFKDVNDRLGHQAGDVALQRVARILASTKRRMDVAFRVGGEEFAVLMPGTGQDGALKAAERLRCALLEEFAEDAVPLSISFGVATFRDHGETSASLLHAADDALYEAKESGRNRSVVFSHELEAVARRGARKGDVEGDRFLAVMLDLAGTVDLRFSGSARHSETVGRYAEMTARELGLPEQRIGRVRLAGLLHDIGKVGVSDAILNKPGSLTAEEFDVLRAHPAVGAQFLEHPSLADVRRWVATHHERPDGRGYPDGLSGPGIEIEARILAVADAYEAMTSDRAYRASIGHAAARAEVERCAGSQFDPEVVHALLAVLERGADRAEAASGVA